MAATNERFTTKTFIFLSRDTVFVYPPPLPPPHRFSAQIPLPRREGDKMVGLDSAHLPLFPTLPLLVKSFIHFHAQRRRNGAKRQGREMCACERAAEGQRETSN